jgi:hypothetical protein
MRFTRIRFVIFANKIFNLSPSRARGATSKSRAFRARFFANTAFPEE